MLVFDSQWRPTAGGKEQMKFRVRKAEFGDGLVQRAGSGLNPEQSEWDLTWWVDREMGNAIWNFIRSHQGWRSFLWTPPLWSTQVTVTCDEVSRTDETIENDGWQTISAKFSRVYQ